LDRQRLKKLSSPSFEECKQQFWPDSLIDCELSAATKHEIKPTPDQLLIITIITSNLVANKGLKLDHAQIQ